MSTQALTPYPQKLTDTSYQLSYRDADASFAARQAAAVAEISGIAGWLRPEDELKLYELAYFANGPILEIGSYHGRSTVLISTALRDTGRGVPFVSVDVDPEAVAAASHELKARGLGDVSTLVRGSATAFLRTAPSYRPALVFVDGDHSVRGVRADLAALERCVPAGGIVLFHDFADDRNDDPAAADIGVKEGIAGTWVDSDCEFAGVFGCCGLFVRRQGGPDAPPGAPLVLDLLWRAPVRLQVVQRLRRPLGRLVRRFVAALRR
jgi:predicted O-methyltransferase YrrM